MEETRRSPWAVLIAAFLALLLVALPGKAWADNYPRTEVYSDPATGISVELDSTSSLPLEVKKTVEVTVVVDGVTVCEDVAMRDVPATGSSLFVTAPGYRVHVDGDNVSPSVTTYGEYYLSMGLVGDISLTVTLESARVYNDPTTGIDISFESTTDTALVPRSVSTTVIVDGVTVCEDKVVGDIPMTGSSLRINAAGYLINVEADGMTATPSGNSKGVWTLGFGAQKSCSLVITMSKTSADIEIADNETTYGTFSWSKPDATELNYAREVIINVNGVEARRQTVNTPQTLINTNQNDEFWFTPNSSLYNVSDVKFDRDTLDTAGNKTLTIDLTTCCPCGNELCLCPGGAECTCGSGCNCEKCQGTVGENQINTPYGLIGYIPAEDDGYNLTVKLYVNGGLVRTQELPKIQNSRDNNLTFEPADGYYYYFAENSYDLDTNMSSSSWNQQDGLLEFAGQLEGDRDYQNVLHIYLWTFENHVNLDVDRFNNAADDNSNPINCITGYTISFEAFDPATNQMKTYTYDATSFASSQRQMIPTNTKVTLKAICMPGWEAAEWYTDSPFSMNSQLIGNEVGRVTAARDYAYGDVAYLTLNSSAEVDALVWISEVRRASKPTDDEVKLLLDDAAVKIDCINEYAQGHDDKTYGLIDGTFTVQAPSAADPANTTVAINSADAYVGKYNETYEGHELDPEGQGAQTIALTHNGRDWTVAEGASPVTYTVACDAVKPVEPPTDGEITDLLGDGAVKVECVTPESGHSSQKFALANGTYSIETPDVVDNACTAIVTVSAFNAYVNQYNSIDGNAGHELVAGQEAQVIELKLKFENDTWTLDGSFTPAEIRVECKAEDPDAPLPPDFDELDGVFEGALVSVDCKNEKANHETKTYGALEGGVMIGDVVKSEDGTYTVDITVTAARYAQRYNDDIKKTHWLDPENQNTETVKLTYDSVNSTWVAPENFAPIVFTVLCADEPVILPELPNEDELADIVGTDITVSCTTKPNEHSSKTYDPIAGAYSFGKIVDNNDGTFSVEMTVNAAAYVEAFEAERGEHELADGVEATKSITLVYANDAWKVANGETPISFDVTCVEEAPEAPDMPTKDELDGIFGKAAVKIDCASNVGHADKAYGLIDGAYTVGAVVADAEGNYSCSVTVTPYTYIAQYSTDMEAAHTLADGESTSHVFALVYDGGWGLAEGVLNPVTFKAVCDAGSEQPTGPDAPTPEEIQELLVDGAVTIDCVNTEADHTDKTYEIAAGAYTIGDVVADDSGNYTVGITVAAGHYVLHYENDNEDIHHYLVDKTADEKVITLAYVDGKWTLPEGAAPVTFQVTCDPDGGSGDEDTPKPPTFDELFALIDVQLDCVNEEIDHPDSHNVLLDGSYELGVITGNAEKGFGITVAVDSAKYLEQYAAFFGEHKIAEGEDASKTVSLTYDNGWKLADGTDKATVPFNITCADGGSGDEGDKPESPTYEQLKQLIWVNLDCTNPSAGHRDSYTQLMRDTYTLGEVQEGDEGVYTLVVTVDSADYIAMYEEFYGDHQLAYGETATKTVTLVYGEDGWAVQGDNVVTFDLTCYGGPDDDPDWPDWPDNPDDPDDPDQPDNPDDPDDPDTPDQPDDPDNPDDPDTPDTPDQPGDDDDQDDPDQPGTVPGDDDGDKGDGCKPGNKPGDQGAGDKSDIPQTSDPFNPALVAVMGVAGIGLVGAGLYASRRRS